MHTYVHRHTHTQIQSGEAVVELRTQQGWLPQGVSRRWAEIRLCDCDCMSERICTPQQFSIPRAKHTHTHAHNTTRKHTLTNFYTCSLHHLQQCSKTGSLDNTWPGCMTEFLVFYTIYQAYSGLCRAAHTFVGLCEISVSCLYCGFSNSYLASHFFKHFVTCFWNVLCK